MGGLIDGLNAAALDLAGSPWVLVAIFALSAIDGFFPPVPAESVIVALAAISVSSAAGEPSLVLLGVAAAVGALLGDNIAFYIGRAVGVERFDPEHRPRLARTVAWARRELDHRATMLILVGRHIPVGRIAVNMTAGATGFPHRRFLPISAIAGAIWATYAVLIGVLAGAWIEENPLVGALLAIAVASLLGYAVDRVVERRRSRRATAAPEPS